jgi:hypothetical protein
MYLEKGTQLSPIREQRDPKFWSVGLITMNLGGYIQSSSRGFKDCMTV